MTTAEKPRSAYPTSVDALLPRARELATELGKLPSRNQLMAELKVGAPKAREVLTVLNESGFNPAAQSDPKPDLHLVRDPGPEVGPEVGSDPASDRDPVDPNPVPPVGSDPVSDPGPVADSDPVPTVGPNPGLVDSNPVSNPGLQTDLNLGSDSNPVGSDPVSNLGPNPVAVDLNPVPDPVAAAPVRVSPPQVSTPADPGTDPGQKSHWGQAALLVLLSLPAFVAIWSGWVGLGGLTGFGVVHPLPGIWDELSLNTAITLPIGVEAYAAFALRVWLSGRVPDRAREFAKVSAIGSLALGAGGQVAYHLMVAAGMTQAPWQITTVVACLPVAVLGMGAALAHLLHSK